MTNLGAFDAGGYHFEVDDGFTLIQLEASTELNIGDVADRLSRRLQTVDAPLASWLFARLAAVADGHLDFETETIEVCEDALWIVDFVVRDDNGPIGKLQIQACHDGTGLLGVLKHDVDSTAVIDAFFERLLEAPADVATHSVSVRDPEWPAGRVARYGYDGARFL